MLVSIVLSVVEPVSAAMLAAIVVRTHAHHRIPFALRMCIAALAGGLLVHAASQIELVFNYRAPRTWAWLALVWPINAVVWAGFFYMRRHERTRPVQTRPPGRSSRPRLLQHP